MERLKLLRPDDRADLAYQRRREVEAMHNQGYLQTQIAEILGITQARVSQIVTSFAKTRNNKRRRALLRTPPPAWMKQRRVMMRTPLEPIWSPHDIETATL